MKLAPIVTCFLHTRRPSVCDAEWQLIGLTNGASNGKQGPPLATRDYEAAPCPSVCSTCRAGGAEDGGVALDRGVCRQHCSLHRFCGQSAAYKNGGVDCTGCATAAPAAATTSLTKGEWVKPIYGTFKGLKMDCGYSGSGVLGSITLKGTWTWAAGGKLEAVGTASVQSSNLVWNPMVPGYKGESDGMWHNHISHVHWPNFGANFGAIHSKNSWAGKRYVFTCNPQSKCDAPFRNCGAHGASDTAWAGGSGTKFVRVWLEGAYDSIAQSLCLLTSVFCQGACGPPE